MTTAPVKGPLLIMAGKGSTEGTVATTLTAVPTFDSSISGVATAVERPVEHGGYGSINSDAMTGTGWNISTNVFASSSGVAGTPPISDPLLLACGLNRATAGGIVTYSPYLLTAGVGDWVDLDYNDAGQKHLALGCRGTFTLSYSAGECPRFAFDMTGLYAAPANEAISVPTFGAHALPLPVNSVNTPTLTIGGVAVCLSSLTLNSGLTVGIHDGGACTKRARITMGAPTVEMVIYRPELSSLDAYAAALNGTDQAVTLVHGPVGNRVTLSIPRLNINSLPSVQDVNGLSGLQISGKPKPTAGAANHYSIAFSAA